MRSDDFTSYPLVIVPFHTSLAFHFCRILPLHKVSGPLEGGPQVIMSLEEWLPCRPGDWTKYINNTGAIIPFASRDLLQNRQKVEALSHWVLERTGRQATVVDMQGIHVHPFASFNCLLSRFVINLFISLYIHWLFIYFQYHFVIYMYLFMNY